MGAPLEEPLLQGARRAHGQPQRLREHPELRALRHDGRHRGLDVLDRRLARLHVRDRRRTGSTRRTTTASSTSTSAAARPRAPARAATARRTTRCSRRPSQERPALGDRGLGAGGLDADDHARRSPPRPRRSGTTTSAPTSGRSRRSRTRCEYSMVTDGPAFEWNVNPSTRPVVAGRDGRDAQGPPQAPIALRQPGRPAGGEHRRPARGSARGVRRSTSQGLPAVDNGRFTVHIDWADPNTDWDVYVYDAAGNVVSQSASFGDTTEDAVLLRSAGGHVHGGDRQLRPGRRPAVRRLGQRQRDVPEPEPARRDRVKEAWTLTCERPDGTSGAPIEVIVDRGGRADVGDACA